MTIVSTAAAPTANYLGVYCDQGNAANTQAAPPPATLPTATTVLSGVTIGPNYDYGIIAGTTTSPAALLGCNIKITGSTVNGNNNGMWIVGCGTGLGKISCAGQLGDGTAAGGNTFSNNKSGGSGLSVKAWDCVSPLSFDNNTFDSDDNGVFITNHSGPGGGDSSLPQPDVYEVRNNTFKNLTGTGLTVDRGAIIDQLTGNTFTGISTGATGSTNGIGIAFTTSNSGVNHARSNSFIGNDVGIQVEANAFVATTRTNFDWGTAADPGNNVFACNSSAHAGGMGGDFLFEMAAGSTITLPMRTNKWDHAPPTSSATLADGLDIHTLNSVTLDTTGAALANVTCPAGHIK